MAEQPVVPQVAAATAPIVLYPGAADITVENDMYTAVFTENGGALKKLVLKKYKETSAKDSPGSYNFV